MPRIEFNATKSSLSILNPFKDFQEELHDLEVRKDPLLGHTSIYNPSLKEKVRFFFHDNNDALINDAVRSSEETCPFCSGRLEENTPMYPRDFIAEGRLKFGEVILFPNLYPLGEHHAVIVLTKRHFLRLSEFEPSLVQAGLQAAQKFTDLVYRRDPSAHFVAINANYLFPAGATLIHPHLQMLITPDAFTHHERVINACQAYLKENRTSYFSDLVAEEKRINTRYVAQKGGWHWMAPFSPMGMNEIVAVHEKTSDYHLLSESDLADLAYGISRVLSFYESLGHLSFNYSILSVRDPRERESCRCFLRIVNRQNLYRNYRNDDYFLQKLLHSDFIINLPEELAVRLRDYF